MSTNSRSSGALAPIEARSPISNVRVLGLRTGFVAFLTVLKCLMTAEEQMSFLEAPAAKAELAEQIDKQVAKLIRECIRLGERSTASEVLHDLQSLISKMDEDDKDRFLERHRSQLEALCAIVGDDPIADWIFQELLSTFPDDESRLELKGNRNLRKARGALEKKDWDLAIRHGAFVIKAPTKPHLLRAEAHAIRAKGFRGLDDTRKEFAETTQWWEENRGAGYRGGPIDRLVEILDSCDTLSETAKKRADEILLMISRLAELYERQGQHKAAAEIYENLIDLGFSNFIDENLEQPATIRARWLSVGQVESLIPGLPAGDVTLEVISPTSNGFRVTERDAVRAVEHFLSPLGNTRRVLKLRRIKLAESKVEHRGISSQIGPTFVYWLTHAAKKSNFEDLPVHAQCEQVATKSPGSASVTAILLEHDLETPELRGIGFLLRPVCIGTQVELVLHQVFLGSQKTLSDTRRKLISLLIDGTDDLGGIQVLEKSVVKLILWAGKNLDEAMET